MNALVIFASGVSVILATMGAGQPNQAVHGCKWAKDDPSAVVRSCTRLLRNERVPQPWMYFNRGLALRMLGRLHDARRDYSEAIRLDPTFAAAHTNRANVLLLLSDTAGALADLREAIRLDPNDYVARQNLEAIESALRRLDATEAGRPSR